MKKIFIFLLIGMFLILAVGGIIIAEDFLSIGTKDYDNATQTITIKDSSEKDLVNIKLLTPLEHKVGMGYQMVASYEVTSLEDLKLLMVDIELYDKNKEMAYLSRSMDLKVNSTIPTEVNDYKIVCELVWSEENKTNQEECSRVIVGSHFEDKSIWINLDKVDFIKDEKIVVGLFTNVKEGDYIEWIPTFEIEGHDYRVPEWSTWKESLNTNIVAYYRLENSTDQNDEVNEYDGAGTSDTYVAGHINNALNTGYVTLADQNDFDFSGAFSISMWYKYSGQAGDDVLIGKRSTGIPADWFMTWDPGDHDLRFYSYGSASIVNKIVELEDGSYHHVVVTRDASNDWVLYLDDASVDTANDGRDFTSTSSIGIGSLPGGVVNDNTKLDELAIYKGRALSPEDVTYIFESTTGYSDDFGPSDTCTYSSGNWEVNCNDNCSITTNVDLTGNTLIISGGDGSFEVLANITMDELMIPKGVNCELINIPNDGNELRIKHN